MDWGWFKFAVVMAVVFVVLATPANSPYHWPLGAALALIAVWVFWPDLRRLARRMFTRGQVSL